MFTNFPSYKHRGYVISKTTGLPACVCSVPTPLLIVFYFFSSPTLSISMFLQTGFTFPHAEQMRPDGDS